MDAPVLTARSRSWQQGLLPAVFAVFVVVSVQYTYKALQHRSAFVRWREQILQLESGHIYERYNYPNPPIMALMLRPLAELPTVAGAVIWFYLKAAMALWSLWAVFHMLERRGPPFPLWAKGLTALLSLRPLIGDLQHGNVNILILFLVVAALFAFCRRHSWLAGMLLALAIACKVTPLLLLAYFLWKRQWRVLGGSAVGLIFFLALIPGAFLGFRENFDQLHDWARNMVLPFVRDGVITSEHHNQSFPGVVARLLTHRPSFVEYPNGVWTPTEHHNIADIGAHAARWVIRVGQLLFVLMVIRLCRAPVTHSPKSGLDASPWTNESPGEILGGWRLAAEFALIMVGMLVFSERTWKHHCVMLVMPFAVLIYAAATQPLSRRAKCAVGFTLAAVMGLMLSASGLLPERAADLAMVYGVYLWALLLLVAALAALLRFGSQQPDAPVTAPAAP